LVLVVTTFARGYQLTPNDANISSRNVLRREIHPFELRLRARTLWVKTESPAAEIREETVVF